MHRMYKSVEICLWKRRGGGAVGVSGCQEEEDSQIS